MIPLYILGLLLRFGPQHGYQIKKLLEDQLGDFTQIKLPTVNYHLEKMEAADIIFEHHILHFQAELEWAEQSIRKFEETDQDENESH